MAEGTSADPLYLLQAMEVRDLRETYFLGRGASRLTFQSQQQRAFNLVWALHQLGGLGEGSRVAVVGGGLAGLSAALAADRIGAAVTIFESRGQVLHLQRGCHTRYIHPNALD